MGLLRVILAIAVLLVHTGGLWNYTITGVLAVEMFYIISGFYMSLVLNERYPPGKNFVFWSARLVRLLPVYWAALLLALVAQFAIYRATGGGFFHYAGLAIHALPLYRLVHYAISNVIIFGLDWVNFMGFLPLGGGKVPPLALVPIPTAWTVDVELSFYLVAPFILRRRTGLIVGVLVLSVLTRIVFRRIYGGTDFQWSYGFFPYELALFMLGALAYRLYRWMEGRAIPFWMTAFAAGFIGFTLLFDPLHAGLRQLIGAGAERINVVMFILQVPAIAVLFAATRKNRLDQRIGEFSYPIYLLHFIFVQLYAVFVSRATDSNANAVRSLVCLVLTLAASWVLVVLVEHRVDVLRARWTSRKLKRSGQGSLPIPQQW